jgi:hypothetical protein
VAKTDEIEPTMRLEAVDHDPFQGVYRAPEGVNQAQFQFRMMNVLNAANARRDAHFAGHSVPPTTPESVKQFQDAYKLMGAKTLDEKIERLTGGFYRHRRPT